MVRQYAINAIKSDHAHDNFPDHFPQPRSVDVQNTLS